MDLLILQIEVEQHTLLSSRTNLNYSIQAEANAPVPFAQRLSKSHLKSSRELLFTLKAKCGANNGICLADTFQELFNFSLSLSITPPLSLPLSHSVFDLIVAIHFSMAGTFTSCILS